MTEADFLQAILNDPASADLTWLVLADWLEERGDPRFELVRLQHDEHYRSRLKPDAREKRLRTLLASGLPPVVPTFTNSLGMEFVLVGKGTFWMGSPADERDRYEFEGQKMVSINYDFFLGKFTVTQAQWQAVMGNNPSYFSRTGRGSERVKDIGDEELREFPVETVPWSDIVDFLKVLNECENDQHTAWLNRLPHEAEWEYACRGGQTFSEESETAPFYFANPTFALSSTQANFDGNYPSGPTEKGSFLERPCRVGSYAPNGLGLHDMHGNIWEWCNDILGGGLYRVIRGGSWGSHAWNCRAANRDWEVPGDGREGLGFRLARVPLANR